jgi:hypothetical protein
MLLAGKMRVMEGKCLISNVLPLKEAYACVAAVGCIACSQFLYAVFDRYNGLLGTRWAKRDDVLQNAKHIPTGSSPMAQETMPHGATVVSTSRHVELESVLFFCFYLPRNIKYGAINAPHHLGRFRQRGSFRKLPRWSHGFAEALAT